MFNAWSAVVYYVTVIGGMFLTLGFDLWPLTKFPGIMKQPLLGLVWSLVVGAIVFYIGVVAMNMNVVWFMVHVPVAFIFGTIIVLNMLQRSLFGRDDATTQGRIECRRRGGDRDAAVSYMPRPVARCDRGRSKLVRRPMILNSGSSPRCWA